MKGISKAAENQSMGIHKHPVRPAPSLILGLQTLPGLGNRIETSPESGEKGPRGEGSAAIVGKTRQVGLSSTRTLERKQLEHWYYVLFISAAWLTVGAQHAFTTLNLISTSFLPQAHPFSPPNLLVFNPTTPPLCSVEEHRLWY